MVFPAPQANIYKYINPREGTMERGKKTGFILRQFRKKSKRLVHKDLFTEFFYLNKDRRVIEFLSQDDQLVVQSFFNQFLPDDMKGFVKIKLMNDMEEEIKVWYFDSENLVIVLDVNWGFKKQEVSIDMNIENFCITVVEESGMAVRDIDYVMFNDYLISFFTAQARTLAKSFETLNKVYDKKE